MVIAEDRIELAGFIYEGGNWDDGIIMARQAALISTTGQIAPKPLGAKEPNDDADEETEDEHRE
jgi:hypothetical protein